MPLILPGNVASATASTAYSVANSLRFNRADEPILTRTQSTSPTHDDKCTMSLWFKPGAQTETGGRGFSFGGSTDVNSRWHFYIETDAQLYYYGKLGGSVNMTINSTNMYRDPAAWYHYCVAIDTTQGTAANRVRTYINNVEVTAYEASTYPSQNDNCPLVKDANMLIGAIRGGSYQLYNWSDAYLSEIHFIDGLQLTPASFAEYDSDSPSIWKPKDCKADLTYGTNGFYLEFKGTGTSADSSGMGADTSGNDNHLAATNLAAADQSTDSPTNNFATLNPLVMSPDANVYSQGNCSVVTHDDNYYGGHSTIGVSKGKWYFEVEMDAGADISFCGISAHPALEGSLDKHIGNNADAFSWGMYGSNGNIYNNNSDSSYGNAVDDGDIIGVYMDLDNNKLYFADNGTVLNSGTGISITAAASTSTGVYHFGVGDGSSGAVTALCNFGGCSAFTVSSGNADANGYGNFEYDPSAGTFDSASKEFLALCTANLATDG